MVALDDAIWRAGALGGIGPPGWLGSGVMSEERTFYISLHDYHLESPDLSPELVGRCRAVIGGTAILSSTSIAEHTNLLTSDDARLFSDDTWVGVVGESREHEALIAVGRPLFEDVRIGALAFLWESVAGREDNDLNHAAAATFAHAMASQGYEGIVTTTDDPALIRRFTLDQPVMVSPRQMLVRLGREDMLAT